MSCYFCERAKRGAPYIEHRHIARPPDSPVALVFAGAVMVGLPMLMMPDGTRR